MNQNAASSTDLADREQAVVLVDRRLAGGNLEANSLPASTS